MMKDFTERIISNDLRINPEDIRSMSWAELDKRAIKHKGRLFRPENLFVVSGNIHLANDETMGLTAIRIRDFFRGVRYRIKCLMRSKEIN